MDLLSAIGGLVVGIFGSWIAYKNRSSPQREILYNKQAEVYSNAIKEAHNVFSFSVSFINSTKEEQQDSQEQLLIDYVKFMENTAEVGGFGPTGVYVAYSDFLGVLSRVCNPHHEKHGEASQKDLEVTYYQFINSIRRSMGVDALTEESMGLYKKPSDTLDYLDVEPFHERFKNSNGN